MSQARDPPSISPNLEGDEDEGYGCIKPATIFKGKSQHLGDIPCLRSSGLNGIYGGVAAGLIHFALKSNVYKASCTAGMAFSVILLVNWTLCRINYVQDRHTFNLAREKLMEYIEKRDESIRNRSDEG